jgi:hypothetical protein
MHGTHQDRLVKKLRRKESATHAQANAYLEAEYLPDHNRRFARAAARAEDYHRRAPRAGELDKVFRLESVRRISDDWVVRYDNRFFQLQRQSHHYAPVKSQVAVGESRDGGVAIEYRGRALHWEEIPAPAKATGQEATELGHGRGALAPRLPKQKWVPAPDHPWRKPLHPGVEKGASGGSPVSARSSLALPSASP